MRRILMSLAVLFVVCLLVADSASALGRRNARCAPCCTVCCCEQSHLDCCSPCRSCREEKVCCSKSSESIFEPPAVGPEMSNALPGGW